MKRQAMSGNLFDHSADGKIARERLLNELVWASCTMVIVLPDARAEVHELHHRSWRRLRVEPSWG